MAKKKEYEWLEAKDSTMNENYIEIIRTELRMFESQQARLIEKVDHLSQDVQEIQASIAGIRINREQNGITNAQQDQRLQYLEDFKGKHETIHQEEQKTKGQRNWQMWVLIISLALTSIANLIIHFAKS